MSNKLEEDLYDEFGNYIGPELDGGNDEQDGDYNEQRSDLKDRQDEDQEEKQMPMRRNLESQVVLYEDKKYYPELQQVYPEAEAMIQEEDNQPITQPIIASVKPKEFDIVERQNPETTYSMEFFKNIMKNAELIRNVGIIGHLHHGKTTLMDMFVQQTHEQNWDLNKEYRYTDSRRDEQDRQISIKAKPMSLILPNDKGQSYLMNLYDTPGHVNFSDEACCALRACDGVLVVVDAVQGVMLGTERLLRYCVLEKIQITVLINKMDRLVVELKMPPADAYLKIKHTLEEINGIISSAAYHLPDRDSWKVSPLLGNVAFASSLYGFIFTLQSFVQMYVHTFPGISPEDLKKILWGNYYFNSTTRKFSQQSSPDAEKRTFVEFILEPVYKIFSVTVSRDQQTLKPVLARLGVYLQNQQYKLDIQPLLRLVFGKFFGNTSPLITMLVNHIPSSKEATKYKLENTYLGSKQTELYTQLGTCSANEPLLINIVQMYNKPDCLSFDALGRIISGTIKQGDTVNVLGENYNSEDQEDMATKTVKKLYIFQSRYRVEVKEALAGNWVLIEGIDQSISKTATIVHTHDSKQAFEVFRPIQHNTTPVMKVSIEPLIPSELPQMLEGLRKINKSYPILITKVQDSGEHLIVTTGELYLDCVLHDLRQMYADIEIKVSDPCVTFCQTVIESSGIKCYAETPNKMNQITILANPLDKGLDDEIEQGSIDLSWDQQFVEKYFRENYNWDILQAKSVWSFGPDQNSPNLIYNDTLPDEVNQSHLGNCRDSIVQGFQWATREGPLCDEPVRNVKFRIIDAKIAQESQHRTGGQIIPTARRACYSAFLMATPRLMEPMLNVEIQCTADAVEAVLTVLMKRRGHMVNNTAKPGSPLCSIKAALPAIDSFGFETDLRIHTSGQAFCSSVFDSWELLLGDPLDKNVQLSLLTPSATQDLPREVLIKTRRRKGLNENVSIVKYFDDKDLLESLRQEKDYQDYI